eukprot:jgi/Tetstr1/448404/TSEL_035674.t1
MESEEASVHPAPEPGAGVVWRGGGLHIRAYRGEEDLATVMALIDNELSEPYSIFTYRYFIYNWPNLCFLAIDEASGRAFGTVVCKLDPHGVALRGYLAMLVVEKAYRGKQIGTWLVRLAIDEMIAEGADEVVLEAEVTNRGALALYAGLGFIRDKRLLRYYLNGVDAFRLKLMLPDKHRGPRGVTEAEGGEWVEMAGIEPSVHQLQIT